MENNAKNYLSYATIDNTDIDIKSHYNNAKRLVYPKIFFFMLALLLVFGSVSSSSSSSPFNLLNNAFADKGMMGGGGGSGGGGSGGNNGNSGDGDGKDSSSSDSGKKSKDKKDKKEDGGRKGEGDNGNTNTISGTSGNLIDDLFGTGDESSSGATTTTATEEPIPSTTTTEGSLSSTTPIVETDLYPYKPPELPENFGLVPSQKILGDGSKQQVTYEPPVEYEHGYDKGYTLTTTWSTDGTVTMVSDYEDGSTSTETFVPVGSKFIRLIERADGSKHTTKVDGTTIEEDPKGNTVTRLPDKTQIEKKLDGFSGQFIVTTTRPDNTKTVVDPDGKETFLDANGNTQKIVFPKKDGTFDVYDPNAGTTVNTNTKPDR